MHSNILLSDRIFKDYYGCADLCVSVCGSYKYEEEDRFYNISLYALPNLILLY